MSRFNYVWCATHDWEGLYDNGELVMQAHQLQLTDLARYLGLDWHTAEVPDENVEMCGLLPDSIDDLAGVNLGERK